jgi:hypothetical protein
MVSTSLDMLQDSLVKKLGILTAIEEQNVIQKSVLSNPEEVNMDDFNKTVDVKGNYIDQLGLLDEGFQALFDRVKEELDNNREQYADQIRKLQKLIKEITAKSASIEAQEHRNKKLAENYFSAERRRLNQGRQSSAAAFNYYRTMNNFKDIPPQYLDQKN